MDRMGCRSHAWVETAPPQLITVRRRALRELALDTIMEEGFGISGTGQSFQPSQSSAADQALRSGGVNLHQHRHAVAFAQ